MCGCVECFNCVPLSVIECVMVRGLYILSIMLGVIVCVCFMSLCAFCDVSCVVVWVAVCVCCVLRFE